VSCRPDLIVCHLVYQPAADKELTDLRQKLEEKYRIANN